MNVKIFYKIKNYLFDNKNKIHKIENKHKKTNEDNSKNQFFENLKVDEHNIFLLQRKLKNNNIKVRELTDEELDKMINLYRSQINDKKKILNKYRKLIIKGENL